MIFCYYVTYIEIHKYVYNIINYNQPIRHWDTMFKINFMLCVSRMRTIEVCSCTAGGGCEEVIARLRAQWVQQLRLRIGYE